MAQYVAGGDPLEISAADWNDCLAAARANKGLTLGIEVARQFRQSGIIRVRSNVCGEWPRFAVVGFARGSILRPSDPGFQQQPAMEAAAPAIGDENRFGVLFDAVPSCQMGRAVVSGASLVKIQVSNVYHAWARAVVGETRWLESTDTPSSAQILWAEPGADGEPTTGLRWAVVRISNAAPLPIASAPTTTTTLAPCSGACLWTWNDAAGAWSITTDGCAPTTTTTTTPAPGSTTTTTTCCPWPTTTTTTTTPGAGSTTTTTTTTTTTPNPCACQYPRYCGTTDGECTRTNCTTGSSSPQVNCTTTTSTTTTTPDPSCDCATTTTTTTTADPGCVNGCDWAWLPFGANWGWVLLADNCAGRCPCSPPASSGTNCANAHTSCTATPPPATTTPPPGCSGSCDWVFHPGSFQWILVASNCSGGVSGCACVPPSITGSACGKVQTSCATPPTTTTTTTPNPATTTTTPAPCWQCYTTTTAPTTTTTTTPGPCDGVCKWQWSVAGGAWTQLSSTCAAVCPCLYPPYAGTADCETIQTPCGPTTTTTTTTDGPCVGQCVANCVGGVWVPDWNTCTGTNCGCPPCEDSYISNPCVEGAICSVNCGNTTTTTTTPPPTTTTPPTTTPPPTTTAGPTTTTTTAGPTTTTTAGPTTTTTTTTCCPYPTCACWWRWSGTVWQLQSGNCNAGCHCAYPAGPCPGCPIGQTTDTACEPD